MATKEMTVHHEQAILVNANAKLGDAETPVAISDVEKHYPTTAVANAGITYRCANEVCGVPVKAVIPLLSKPGRKTSPASYFRADKNNPHVTGCTRRPSSSSSPTRDPGNGSIPANPNRSSAPAVWTDPMSDAMSKVGGGTGVVSGGPAAQTSGSRGRRGTRGSGTSLSQSQMIGKFAKEWIDTNADEQRSMPLQASWNPAGTYHSAFNVLHYKRNADFSRSGQKIHVGMLRQVQQNESEYVIVLSETGPGGELVQVIVPLQMLSSVGAGAALQTTLRRLSAMAIIPLTQVFALGEFIYDDTNKLSLVVMHPYYIYIP